MFISPLNYINLESKSQIQINQLDEMFKSNAGKPFNLLITNINYYIKKLKNQQDKSFQKHMQAKVTEPLQENH